MDTDTLRADIAAVAHAQYAQAGSRQRLYNSLSAEHQGLIAAYLLGGCDEATWQRAVSYALAPANG